MPGLLEALKQKKKKQLKHKHRDEKDNALRYFKY